MMEFLENEEAIPERLKMKIYDEAGNILTEWDEELGYFTDGMEQNEFGEWIMTRIFHPFTEEQLVAIRLEKEKTALIESRRELTLEEVADLLIRRQVNAVDIPDQTSLRMKKFYPTFSEIVGQTVKQGFKFTYDDELWKTVQADLLIQEHYPPGAGMESLYMRIDLKHTGKEYDPIPYDGNMILENGKYYIQNNVIYVCIRDTGTAVYHALTELVGLYVDLFATSNLTDI